MIFANLSGGRDSTAMIVRSLELGNDIDYILFCDLGFEFDEMYRYIDKLKNFIFKNYQKEVTTINSSTMFEKWAFEYPIQKGKHEGRLRGLPKEVGLDYCTREGKARPSKKFVKEKGSSQAFKNKVLIGYTYDEVEKGRTSSLDYAQAIYPLHEWKWNEKECEEYLRKRGIANPLYKHFSRTGCFFCPHQNKESLYNLYKHYPKEWEIAKKLENKALELNCVNTSFKITKSFTELESVFKKIPDSFEFENEYVGEVVCFCK